MWNCKEWWNNQHTLGIWCGLFSHHPLPPAKHSHIYWFHLTKTINEERTKNPEMRCNFQQIILYCLHPNKQNTGLREVHLEPSPKRGSDKINIPKQGRKTQKKAIHIVKPRLTYGLQHLERDMEPSAKTGTNTTRALVSLY